VKIHRAYTVEEAARLFGVHKNTVRTWLKTGSRSTAATDPHPGTAAREFSPFAARAQATALPAGRVLLFPLPGAQDLGSAQGRLSAAHGEFGQFDLKALIGCTGGSHSTSWLLRAVTCR
jgi:hypothetical protein